MGGERGSARRLEGGLFRRLDQRQLHHGEERRHEQQGRDQRLHQGLTTRPHRGTAASHTGARSSAAPMIRSDASDATSVDRQ